MVWRPACSGLVPAGSPPGGPLGGGGPPGAEGGGVAEEEEEEKAFPLAVSGRAPGKSGILRTAK